MCLASSGGCREPQDFVRGSASAESSGGSHDEGAAADRGRPVGDGTGAETGGEGRDERVHGVSVERSPFVKICGVTLPEHALAAMAGGAAMIGFMFAEKSRRRLTVEQARGILAALPARDETAVENLTLVEGGTWYERCAVALTGLIERRGPLRVGVFANQPVSLMNSIAETLDLDLIQLSGDEPWESCLRLRRPAIKALRARFGDMAVDLQGTIEAGTAALLLLDAHVPGAFGGTGQRADWLVAAALAKAQPLLLAGGLDSANVAEAVARVRPWGVDVSSGVEQDGVKDVDLIREFLRAARGVATEEIGTASHGD